LQEFKATTVFGNFLEAPYMRRTGATNADSIVSLVFLSFFQAGKAGSSADS
jgi:hypothetical protein